MHSGQTCYIFHKGNINLGQELIRRWASHETYFVWGGSEADYLRLAPDALRLPFPRVMVWDGLLLLLLSPHVLERLNTRTKSAASVQFSLMRRDGQRFPYYG